MISFEKLLSLGVGAAMASKEMISAAVKELVDKGEVTMQQAKDMTDKLVQKGEEQRSEMKKMLFTEIFNTEEFRKIIRKEIEEWSKEQNASGEE